LGFPIARAERDRLNIPAEFFVPAQLQTRRSAANAAPHNAALHAAR
jgi:hypothetical protein